jgi:hypothetical protein
MTHGFFLFSSPKGRIEKMNDASEYLWCLVDYSILVGTGIPGFVLLVKFLE